MRWLWLIPGLLIAGLLAVPPWYAGIQAEDAYANLLRQLERQGLRILHNRYQRGWLSATADSLLQYSADPDVGPQQGIHVRLLSQVSHGPIDFSAASSGLMAARVVTRMRLLNPSGQPLLENSLIRTRVGLQGEARLQFMPAPAAPEELPGLRGELNIAERAAKIEGRVELSRFEYPADTGALWRLEGMGLGIDTRRGAAGLHLGASRLQLDSLKLIAKQAVDALSLKGLHLDLETGAEQGHVWTRSRARIDRLQVAEQDYSHLAMELDLHGLSATVLGRLAGIADELLSGSLDEGSKGLALFGLVLNNLQRLLQAGPTVRLKRFELITPDGPVDVQVELSFSGLTPRALLDPNAWLNSLQAHGRLQLPEAVLRQLLQARADARLRQLYEVRREMDSAYIAPDDRQRTVAAEAEAKAKLAMLLRQELALRDAGQLHTRFRLSAGLLSVNGKTISL